MTSLYQRGALNKRRIAVISAHTSPLAALGGRDTGGMNVYVRELSRELGARGYEIDVFTRRTSAADPDVQPFGPNARVINIDAGPIDTIDKLRIADHLDEFEGNVYKFPDGREVHNEGGERFGPVNLLKATEKSINTAYVDLTSSMKNGPQQVIDSAVRAGIPRNAPGLKPDPTITLGTADIRPVDLASAYATFANQGMRDDWFVIKKVTDPSGHVVYRHGRDDKRAFPEDVTSNVVYAQQQVVKTGTGTAARALGCPAAGKTGTANLRPNTPGVTSAWFAGYTPRLSASVMYVKGNAGTENLDGVGGLPDFFGGSFPARTWTAFMQKALEGQDCVSFPPVDYVNGSPTPTYTPTPSPTKTPSPTESPTESPSPTETPKNTPPPFQSPNPTESPSPSDSSSPILPPPGNGNGRPSGSSSSSP